jgi:hypothetical protein
MMMEIHRQDGGEQGGLLSYHPAMRHAAIPA